MKRMRRFLPDFIIVGVLALAAALVLLPRMSTHAELTPQQGAAPSREVTFTLRAVGLEVWQTDRIDPNALIGSKLTGSSAVITDCWFEPYATTVLTADGESIYSVAPTRSDMVITVSAQMIGEPAVYTVAGQEIRTGRGFFFICGDLDLATQITDFHC